VRSDARHPELPRTLGLRDLVLLKLVAVVNVSLVPPVAGYGRAAYLLWIAAFLTFFLPQATAVVLLSRRYPGEGGIYLWTRRRFGELHGFLSGWCYWTNNLFYLPMQLVYAAGVLAYAGGSGSASLIDDKAFVSLVTFGWLAVMTIANVRGLAVGKWVQNIGAIGTAATVVLILIAGVAAHLEGVAYPAPALAGSGLALLSGLSVACFTFVGFELASTMGDEIEHPARDLPRAIAIAGGLTLLAFLATTAALQALVPSAEIGAIQGVMQALAGGAARAGAGWVVAPAALMIALSIGGGASAWFAGSSRVPFMAGFDRSLPSALGRVHPRWGSPHIALWTTAALSAMFLAFTLVGSTVAEAYQVLLKAGVVIQLVPFVYLFACLMTIEGGAAVRAAGAVGLASSAAGLAFAFVPTEDVGSVAVFETKMLVGVAAPIAVGLAFFSRARSRSLEASGAPLG
jgi:amino acid transporter